MKKKNIDTQALREKIEGKRKLVDELSEIDKEVTMLSNQLKHIGNREKTDYYLRQIQN